MKPFLLSLLLLCVSCSKVVSQNKENVCSPKDVPNSTSIIGDKTSGCYPASCKSNYYLIPETRSCVAPYAARIVKISGDNQTGIRTTQLMKKLKIKVLDQKDIPVSNYSVSFEAKNGGTLSASSSLTDDDGVASVYFTLGEHLGEYTVRSFNENLATIKETSFNSTSIEKDGFLDVSFSGDGDINNSSLSNSVVTVLAQSNKKVITVGQYQNNPHLTRYNEDGSLDTSFGDGGRSIPVFTTLLGVSSVSVQRSVILPDNRIMLFGTYWDNVFVGVLTPNGQIDPSFNGGAVSSRLATEVKSFALDSDSTFVFGNKYDPQYGRYNNVILKIKFDGTMDSSFGTDGFVSKRLVGNWDMIESGTINSDGTIGLFLSGSNFVLLSPTGETIKVVSFSSVTSSGRPEKFEFKRDGKKLLYSGDSGPELLQLNSDMTIDTSFGKNGKVSLDFGTEGVWYYVSNLTTIGDKIVLLASSSTWNGNGSNYTHKVLRLNSDGSVDSSFGVNGLFTYSGLDINIRSNSVNFDSSGRLLLGSAQYSSGNFSEVVVRVTGSTTNGPISSLPSSIVTWNESLHISTSGGIGPYTYEVISGSGSVNNEMGEFKAGSESGDVTIQVTDSDGKTGIVKVTVVKFTLSASKARLYPGQNASIGVASGFASPPFTYSFESNTSGASVSSSGIYSSGTNFGGKDIVKLTDSTGSSNTVSFEIAKALMLNESSVDIFSTKKHTFSASGGKAPYTYSIFSSGGIGSTINPTSGVFIAGSNENEEPVTDKIEVTDAEGNKNYSDVKVARLSGTISTQGQYDFFNKESDRQSCYLFGGTGRLPLPILVQSTFKSVVSVHGNPICANSIYRMFRLNSDGTQDDTFGATYDVFNNQSYTNIGEIVNHNSYLPFTAMTDGNDKIYILSGTISGSFSLKLTRLNNDGTLDETFASSGHLIANIPSLTSCVTGRMQITSAGKIMAMAHCRSGSLNSITSARFNPDGSLDTSYGVGGVSAIIGSTGSEYSSSPNLEGGFGEWNQNIAALLNDDSFVYAGSRRIGSLSYASVLRITPNGELDTAFNEGIGSALNHPYSASVGSINVIDNKIYVAQTYNPNTQVLNSFNSNGTVNTDFGNNGVAIASQITDLIRARMIASDNNGNIYIGDDYGRLYRYRSSGEYDPSFGVDSVGTNIGGALREMTVRPDGKLMAIGAGFSIGSKVYINVKILNNFD